ncbi:MAG: SCP2 sterol-binding domain-containing protein [Pseudomonadota bacterium]
MDEWELTYKRLVATFEQQEFNGSVKFAMDNGRNVVIVGSGGEISAAEDSDAETQTELKMTMSDAVKIVNRKLSPAKAIMTMRLKVRGDMSQAMRIAGYFKTPLPEHLA